MDIKVGDRVYKHTPRGQLGKATKLLHHYEGPFEVLELGRANAQIKRLGVDIAEPEIVHLNRLKLFFYGSLPPEYFSLELDEQTAPSNSYKLRNRLQKQ